MYALLTQDSRRSAPEVTNARDPMVVTGLKYYIIEMKIIIIIYTLVVRLTYFLKVIVATRSTKFCSLDLLKNPGLPLYS